MTDYTQLVCAAAAWAGPGSDEQEVVTRAVTLALLCEDDGVAVKRVRQVMDAKRFVGTMVRVTIEESSTRGILHLFTGPSERHPDGIETVRTERSDTPEGAGMVERARALAGHRVLMFKVNEPIRNGEANVRVCVHLLDLGVADEKDMPAGQQVAARREAPKQAAPAARQPAAAPAPAAAADAAPAIDVLRATIGRLDAAQQAALRDWCKERGFRFAAPDTAERIEMAMGRALELLDEAPFDQPVETPATQAAAPPPAAPAAKPAGEAPKEQTVMALRTTIGVLGANQKDFLSWCKQRGYRMGRPATEAEAAEQYGHALSLVPEDDAVAS